MSPDQPKPRFEPPPWEQEAFERFRTAQEKTKATEDLDAALRAVRTQQQQPGGVALSPEDAPPEDWATAGPSAPDVAPDAKPEDTARIPDVQIDSMLIQLRGEERPASSANKALVNTVIAFMSITGAYIIVRSALLFGQVDSSQAVNTLLAGTLSLVVFLTGLGFFGGAVLLFRKYHR